VYTRDPAETLWFQAADPTEWDWTSKPLPDHNPRAKLSRSGHFESRLTVVSLCHAPIAAASAAAGNTLFAQGCGV
jgi:hypothetical protein